MDLKQKIKLAKNISLKTKVNILAIFDKLSEEEKQKISKAFLNEDVYIEDCKKCLVEIDNLFNKYKRNIRKKVEKDSTENEDSESILDKLNDL